MSASSRDFAAALVLALPPSMAHLQAIGAQLRPYPTPSRQADPRIEQPTAASSSRGAVAGYPFGAIHREKPGIEAGAGK